LNLALIDLHGSRSDTQRCNGVCHLITSGLNRYSGSRGRSFRVCLRI
jgi:hypothetical protein